MLLYLTLPHITCTVTLHLNALTLPYKALCNLTLPIVIVAVLEVVRNEWCYWEVELPMQKQLAEVSQGTTVNNALSLGVSS